MIQILTLEAKTLKWVSIKLVVKKKDMLSIPKRSSCSPTITKDLALKQTNKLHKFCGILSLLVKKLRQEDQIRPGGGQLWKRHREKEGRGGR
jgi:hypothetical protein